MDEKATRTWRWFRWAAIPLVAIVVYGTFDLGFRLTAGAGASGEGWLVVLGAFLALLVLFAVAVAVRLPLRNVALPLAGIVLATTVAAVVAWFVFVTATMPPCAAVSPASC